MNHTYIVKVTSKDSHEVVKQLDVIGRAKASKVADGLEINLDNDKYFVTVEVKEL